EGRPARHLPREHGAAAKPLHVGASAELRDRLLTEIRALNRNKDATRWAHRRMADKNKLSPADARSVEEAFLTSLMSLSANTDELAPRTPVSKTSARCAKKPVIDKSSLALPEPKRIRDREHVRSVAQKACLVCGRRPSDPHHLRFAQSRAMGRKVSDEFIV